MPTYCILNKLTVDPLLEVISSLNMFEKILVQKVKAFQTVYKMGTLGNKKLPHWQMVAKLKGRVFHIPLPLQETLKKLSSDTNPINLNHELYILVRGIPTKSKKIWEEIVDLKKVFDALTWLKNNNDLYSDIIMPKTSDGLYSEELNELEFHMEESKIEQESEDIQRQELDKVVNKNSSDTELHQKKAMLSQIIEDSDKDGHYDYKHYTIYPLYDKKLNQTATESYQMLKVDDSPLDSREKKLDLLCFPDLYLLGRNGQHESRDIKIQEHEFIKRCLTSKHSRFRESLQYIFYLLNNSNNRALSRGNYHKLNMTNPKKLYTASEYLKALSEEQLESNLNTIFSSLRNTEQYWTIPRSNLECMIHHYGPATWFLTLSPSEWLWDDLGDYIRRVNGWHNSTLPTNVLITKDPVSTSRYLDNYFHGMLEFLCSKDNPIGEVTHYFWRREYQGRGMQHFHLLIWVKDAPVLGESSIEEVSKFILKYVTCHIPDQHESPTLYRRVCEHQYHKHNNYCLRSKKKGRKVTKVCRFGFPRPVTEKLVIRDVATSISGRRNLKRRSRLYDLPREKNEVNINDYNPALLLAWEGNIDIQFIGEKSRMLALYITKYMSKSGKCELSDFILNGKNSKNKSLASCLWNIALRFLNSRECGALEAADTLLSIPLYGTDRDTLVKWIDVKQIRSRKLKSRKEIKKLDNESTDIFHASVVDTHYPRRPTELEDTSLYEFVKWYDISKIQLSGKNNKCSVMNNEYCIKRRHLGALINHYKYNVRTQPENLFFSLLLLFKPWRELEDLKNGYDTYAEAFHNERLHLAEAVEYHEKLTDLQKAFEEATNLIQQKSEEIQKDNMSQDDPENPIGVQNIEAAEAMQDHNDLDEKAQEIDVSEMITKLNTDQKRVFDEVIDTVQSDKSILRLYVSGEGGTGKSFLIKTIKCWLRQNLNKGTAVAAPTGLAAFNIDGLTIHRLLMLPVEHGGTPKYTQLTDHVLKVLRANQANNILYIIDEVSMVSNLAFMYIHLRISEIFDTGNSDDGWFGRKHILLFGDMLQLPPVREEPVFVGLSEDKIDKYLGSLAAFNLWAELFHYDELKINMRQQGDDTYQETR